MRSCMEHVTLKQLLCPEASWMTALKHICGDFQACQCDLSVNFNLTFNLYINIVFITMACS